ncbi:MAG: hypothetical protein V1874_12795 [Spirochaetota bacterium]
MNVLSFIFKYGIPVSVVGFILFTTMLVLCIRGVVVTSRQSVLFRLPLVSSQEVEFSEAGKVVLSLEGPLFTSRHSELKYRLTDPYGKEVEGHIVIFRTRSSGFTKTNHELKSYKITHPGRHVFQIIGLDKEDIKISRGKYSLVFTCPHFALSMLYVIGIVISAVFVIGSIVLFFLKIFQDKIQ